MTFSAEKEIGCGTPIAPAKKVTSFEIHWHHGTVLCWASEPEHDFCGEWIAPNVETEVTAPLLRCLADHVPNLTHQNLVILNISLTESMELPVTWLLSTCLMMVWEDRAAGRTARLTTCQAELQARLIVLKHTRWKNYSLHNCAVLLEEMMNLHFS